MVVTCEISFDNNRYGTFYAGQLVEGCVTLKSDKPKEVEAIVVKVVGYSLTKWSERQLTSNKLFAGREDYLSTIVYLVGSEENNNRHIIEAGVHTYNFACQLPYQCPSSFEGRYGCIRYLVKVLLVRPWKYNQAYTHGFTVLKLMDLNFETPQLRVATHSEGYRTFCCGPCKTDPLKMELHLPQAGYVPGQRIPVTVTVINNTHLAVSELRLCLVMLVRYYSIKPEHSRVERIIISRAKGDSVLRQCTRSITLHMDVPATPPTCLEHLIQIAYHLEVEAMVKSLREQQLMIMPLTIGTIPLAVSGIVVQQPPRRSAHYEAAGPASGQRTTDELPMVTSIATIPNGLTPSSADIAPPKYEESKFTVRGNINEEELYAFGKNEFAPLYPVYSIPNPPPVLSSNSRNIGYINQSFN